MTPPLSGIKVVELASFVAVPAAGALLADMGAEVVKVEVPWGEVYRHASPKLAGFTSERAFHRRLIGGGGRQLQDPGGAVCHGLGVGALANDLRLGAALWRERSIERS